MGIPSYFKRLTDTVRGLLSPSIQSKVSCLLVDFNCIVYGCLRSDALLPYTTEESGVWEHSLNEEVCKSLVKLWEAAGRPTKVYIAVDGVVPMAKIKQQRMRRFKSVWWAEKEYEMGVRKRGVDRWDTNTITPGTAYMEHLGRRLQDLCSARGWTVSTSDEPGEGEHKVMEWLRRGNVKEDDGSIVIYGLDADLILLSMLTCVKYSSVFLMREKSEFGKEAAKFGSAPFLFFSVKHLLGVLCASVERQTEFIIDYIAIMSLLGNDFLPHGLTLKIRDGGHDWLLAQLRATHKNGKRFVNEDQLINYDTFRELFGILAQSEETHLMDSIFKKKTTRPMAARTDTERLMMSVQGLPIEWFVEKEFLDRGELSSDWQSVYHRHTPVEACSEYLHGIQWIVDYYIGKKVNMMWYYPWHLPPLWADLSLYTQNMYEKEVEEPALKPQEQLAIVLPMESWHLLRDPRLRRLPTLAPQFWPTKYGFMTLGKTWMWECEADIPILTPGRLRSLLKNLTPPIL